LRTYPGFIIRLEACFPLPIGVTGPAGSVTPPVKVINSYLPRRPIVVKIIYFVERVLLPVVVSTRNPLELAVLFLD
jgi:hypothetical protein